MSFKAFLHRLNRKDKPIFRFHPLTQKFILIGLSLVLILGATKIFAQENYLKQKQDAMFNGSSQESWLTEAMGSNMLGLVNAIAGPLPESVTNTEYTFDDWDTSYKPQGALGIATNVMGDMYNNPPASGIQYIASIKDNLLGKPAYAQGIGFQGLQPLIPLWRGMRNIAYSIISLILIVIGVMVMLRVKISPQTVITIQSAIPKLITTLILITFSYAIAGLLIDLMYFVQAVGLALLFQIQGIGFNDNLIPGNNNFFQLNQAGFGRQMQLLSRFIFSGNNNWLVAISAIIGGIIAPIYAAFAGISITGIAGLPAIGIFIFLGIILVILIIMLAILIQFITLIFGLFKCYVSILMQIIFAPIIISMGAFPNSKTGFESWLKQIIANLTVFPVVFLFLVFVNVIFYYLDDPSTISLIGTNQVLAAELWAPNVLSWGVKGTTGGLGVRLAISLTSFFIVAKIPDLIPQTVFGIKPSPWGQAGMQSYAALMKNTKTGANLGLNYPMKLAEASQGTKIQKEIELETASNIAAGLDPYIAQKQAEATIRAKWARKTNFVQGVNRFFGNK